MQIEEIGSVKKNREGDFDTGSVERVHSAQNTVSSVDMAQKTDTGMEQGADEEKGKEQSEQKEPTKSTIDSVVSEANQRMNKTRCEYSYDEPTKRVSIKVYDKETDELIREVPPEKSLEMLQKMWELAGIMVDEKR